MPFPSLNFHRHFNIFQLPPSFIPLYRKLQSLTIDCSSVSSLVPSPFGINSSKIITTVLLAVSISSNAYYYRPYWPLCHPNVNFLTIFHGLSKLSFIYLYDVVPFNSFDLLMIPFVALESSATIFCLSSYIGKTLVESVIGDVIKLRHFRNEEILSRMVEAEDIMMDKVKRSNLKWFVRK